ncbi:MAG: AI-2E family transporter [Bryobacteraceae bacterium]
MNPRSAVLFLITLAAVILVGLIALPFLPAITGAIGLAVITHRQHDWLRKKIRNQTLAAGLMLTLVIVILVIPAAFVVSGVARQIVQASGYFQGAEFQKSFAELLAKHDRIAAGVTYVQQEFDLSDAVQKASSFIASHVGGFLGGSAATLTQLVLMLFTLFFLYRDREQSIQVLRSFLPLPESQKDILLTRIYDTLYATLQGSLSIALIQGALGGAMFWLLSIPAALLWGVFMSIMALIPSLGTFLVWMPAVVYLFLTDQHWKSAVLLAWGALVISTIDNILYPTLVGGRLRLHTVAVLFSVLGAIAMVGIPGIVLGPLILNVTLTLIDFWREQPVDSSTVTVEEQ